MSLLQCGCDTQVVAYICGDKIKPNDAAETLAKRLQQKRTYKVRWTLLLVAAWQELHPACVPPRCTWHWS